MINIFSYYQETVMFYIVRRLQTRPAINVEFYQATVEFIDYITLSYFTPLNILSHLEHLSEDQLTHSREHMFVNEDEYNSFMADPIVQTHYSIRNAYNGIHNITEVIEKEFVQ